MFHSRILKTKHKLSCNDLVVEMIHSKIKGMHASRVKIKSTVFWKVQGLFGRPKTDNIGISRVFEKVRSVGRTMPRKACPESPSTP